MTTRLKQKRKGNANTLNTILGSSVALADSDSHQMRTKTLTLGGALKLFIETNTAAHHAQISAYAAGEANISLTKAFCAFLVARDFDATVVVGCGFVKGLAHPCPQLVESIKELGEAKVAYNLQHAAVKVNSIVLDLCFLRLGSNFTQLNNYPLRDFGQYFREVKDMRHLMAITPDVAKELARSNTGFTVGRLAHAADILTKVRDTSAKWFVYAAAQPMILRDKTGKKLAICKGDYFSMREKSPISSVVHTAKNPDLTVSLASSISTELQRRSTELMSAPASALTSPKPIKISLNTSEQGSK